ncbi:hypothetical protein ABW11_01110 [Pluralibacter gergoviae]|nr:hypothetical protein ABW11_01110 [Pluralibacter gergoviae]
MLVYDRKTKVSLTLDRPSLQKKYPKSVLRAHSKKGLPFGNPFFYMAEAQRFELWEGFPSPVFKTGEIIRIIR